MAVENSKFEKSVRLKPKTGKDDGKAIEVKKVSNE